MAGGLLEGRRGLVMGVANRRSLAWGAARRLQVAGAELALTCQDRRLCGKIEGLVGDWEAPPLLFECDVTREDQVEALFAELESAWGRLDFLVHSLAYAPREALEGAISETTREQWRQAMEVSAFSLLQLARRAAVLLEEGGPGGADADPPDAGAVVALSYLGGERVVPGYNVMGPCKAALEANVRYLAHELGPRGIRVNAVSPGPVKTLAASAVGDIARMLEHHAERSFLERNVTSEEVGDVVLFLCSDLSRAVTGATIHVDSGYFASGV